MAELAARHMLAAGTSAGASKPASTRKGDPAPPGYVRRCARCPDKCEVTDPALWDPLLAAVYPSSPPLKYELFHRSIDISLETDLSADKELQFPGRA